MTGFEKFFLGVVLFIVGVAVKSLFCVGVGGMLIGANYNRI